MVMSTRKALFPIVLLLFTFNGLASCSEKTAGQVVLEMEGRYCSKWHLCKPPLYCDIGGYGGFEEVGTCLLPKKTGAACNETRTCATPAKCLQGYCRIELGIGENCRDLQRTACKPGLDCRGSLRERSCEGGLDAGYRCNGVHRYCKTGLECRTIENVDRCITRLKEGNLCGMPLTMCGNGLECVSLNGKRTCRKVIGEGGLCDLKKDILCAAGYACYRGKCNALKGVYESCENPYDLCTLGTNCTDTKDVHRCIPLRPLGSCPIGNMTANDSVSIASIDGKNVPDSSEKPTTEPKPTDGTILTAVPVPTDKPDKPDSTKKPAYKPDATGMPYMSDEPDMSDEPEPSRMPNYKPGPTEKPVDKPDKADISKKPMMTTMVTAVPVTQPTAPPKTPTRGEVCNVLDNNCDKNHVCLGESDNAKCHFVQRGWGDCKGEYVLCKPGWHCRGPVGSRLCLLASKKGEKCDNAYFKCENGFTCMRWAGVSKCIEFKPLGASCESQYDVCDAGLSCNNSTKKCLTAEVSATVKLTQGIKQTCNTTNACTTGNVCVGPSTDATCMGWLGEDARCEDRDFVCGGGTGCRGNRGRPQICKKVVPRGKGCDQEYHFCEKGLTCMLWGAIRRCVAFRNENEDCTGNQILCTAGSKCTTVASGNRTCLTPASVAALQTATLEITAIGGNTNTTVSAGTNATTTAQTSTGGNTTVSAGTGNTATTKTFTTTYSNGTVITTITTTYSNGTVVTKTNAVNPSTSPSPSPSGSALPSLKTDFLGITIPIFTAVPIPIAITINPSPSTTPTPSASVIPAIAAVVPACPAGCANGYYCSEGKCVLYATRGASCDGVVTLCRKELTCQGPSVNTTTTTTGKVCEQVNGPGKGCGTLGTVCSPGLKCILWGGTASRCVQYVGVGENCEYTFDLCATGSLCRKLAGDEFRKCYAV